MKPRAMLRSQAMESLMTHGCMMQNAVPSLKIFLLYMLNGHQGNLKTVQRAGRVPGRVPCEGEGTGGEGV